MTENKVINELASILGEDVNSIHELTPSWLKFMGSGVIIDLHIGRWRGRSKLTYSDLGLPEPTQDDQADVLSKLLSLGRKNLLPSRRLRKLDALEASARTAISRNGSNTQWGIFVTAERYQRELKDILNRFHDEYFAALYEIIDDLEAVKAEVADEYRPQARLAYRRLVSIAPGMISGSEDEFADDFIASIIAMIPTETQIEESFFFEWDLNYIPLPNLLGAQDQVDYETEMQSEKESQIEASAERDRQRRITNAEIQTRREILARAQAEKEVQVTGFMRDLVAKLRSLVYEATTDILGTVSKNKFMHPRSVVQLRNLFDMVEQLNFFGDTDIDAMMARLQAEMDKVKSGNTDTASLMNNLEAIAVVTRETLLNIGESPRSAREYGIQDVPTVNAVRRARQVLDLDIKPVESSRQARMI